jgi:hypothetical protein
LLFLLTIGYTPMILGIEFELPEGGLSEYGLLLIDSEVTLVLLPILFTTRPTLIDC